MNQYQKQSGISKLALCSIMILMMGIIQACQYKEIKRKNNLQDSITNYKVLLRWGFYQKLYDYHYRYDKTLEDRNYPPPEFAQLKDTSVTSIKLIQKVLNKTEDLAEIKFFIQYTDRNQKIKELSLTQTWWYDTEKMSWFIDSPFPDFQP